MSCRIIAYCTLIVLGFFAASPSVLAWDEKDDCVKPPDGMVGWWPGNGNTNDVWAGHDGQLVNGASFGPGKVKQAFRLNGTGAFVNVPNTPSLNFGTGDFTVDLWVLFNTTAGEQVLVEKWIQDSPTGNHGWTLTKLDDNALLLALGDDDGTEFPVTSDPLSIPLNTFHHVAARRDGTVVTLFFNGNIVASKTIPGGVNVSSASSLKFGKRCNASDTPGCNDVRGFFLNGRIDEVELFHRAVSDARIRAIYNAGSAGKCEPVSGRVNGFKLEEVSCRSGDRKSVRAVITDSRQFWNCTRAGFTVQRGDDVQVKIKGTAKGK